MQNPIPAASCRSPLKSDVLHADPRCNLTCFMPSDVLHADPADDTPRKHGRNRLTKTCTAAFRAHLDQPQWRVHRRQQCRHRRLPKTPPHWRSLPSMAVCAKGHTPPFLRRGTDSVTPRLKAPFFRTKDFRWCPFALAKSVSANETRERDSACAGACCSGPRPQTGGGAGRPKFRLD